MSTIKKFEDLEVWKLARYFAIDIYLMTASESFKSDFRFREQLRASAGSVMDNIAEGFERDGTKEFVQFLYIAKASCGESRSQLYRALDVRYIEQITFDEIFSKANQISRSLSGFIKYLKNSEMKGRKYK